jgi:hypothetical protein
MPVLVCLVLASTPARSVAAQSPDVPLTIGNATAQLAGPWKFHPGDDPAWARPDYDDSAWGTLDLTPPPGTFDPTLGSSGFVNGWTSAGYPKLNRFAWYRLRIRVQGEAGAAPGPLMLKMPDNFDDAYQVYVNGQNIGEFGHFQGDSVTIYSSQPAAYALPAGTPSGDITIAVRFWLDPASPLATADAGGMHGPPVLGQPAAIEAMLRLDWDEVYRSAATVIPMGLVYVTAIVIAFVLFWLDRKEKAYLWLCLTTLLTLIASGITLVNNTTFWMGLTPGVFANEVLLVPLCIGFWIVFWASWFRLARRGLLYRATLVLVVLLIAALALMFAPLYGNVVPVENIVWISPLAITIKLLLGGLLIWVTVRGIRKNRAEGWLALPAVVLVAISLYLHELILLHFRNTLYPFGVPITVRQIATLLSLSIITVLLVRRFLESQREQIQFRLEMEQARQVQQMLMPEETPFIPGFVLESEYIPAQQVGGDFFQILPMDEGGVLVIIGDVSGKGLKAAMLVSLIVGTIRTLAETTHEPLRILDGINRRLHGRLTGQFATCLVVRIDADGATTVANAGHLAPYVNGEEIVLTGSIPLGLVAQAEFEQVHLKLNIGDRITLITDGIVEARNEARELFGFTRTGELMQQNHTAAEIAATAQSFGQEDDITVESVIMA